MDLTIMFPGRFVILSLSTYTRKFLNKIRLIFKTFAISWKWRTIKNVEEESFLLLSDIIAPVFFKRDLKICWWWRISMSSGCAAAGARAGEVAAPADSRRHSAVHSLTGWVPYPPCLVHDYLIFPTFTAAHTVIIPNLLHLYHSLAPDDVYQFSLPTICMY